PTLLPRGEKGANHGKSNQLISPHTTAVGCNKRSAVHRENMLESGAIHFVLYTLLMLPFPG
ncbi:TPA: hypothetical protein ACSP2N_001812, partial [Aeromonas veronii]